MKEPYLTRPIQATNGCLQWLEAEDLNLFRALCEVPINAKPDFDHLTLLSLSSL
jgi:hypothetical protein